MNVVVTRNSMNTYQLIFRHLFELKCVERELNKVWKIYQRARRISRYTIYDSAFRSAIAALEQWPRGGNMTLAQTITPADSWQ